MKCMVTAEQTFLNQIFCDNALKFTPTLPDEFLDMVITSPPYNVDLQGYDNFKDKKELFIRCINKIFLDWRREVVESDDILLVWRKMALAFHRAWPEWSDMMNLLRAAAVKYPDEFADRLQEALTTRIKPIINDVKKATRSGSIRDVDPEITGIMLAAIADYISYYIYRGRFKDKKLSEVFDVVLDIFFHGLASS